MELKNVLEMLKEILQFKLFTLNQTPVTIMSIVIFVAMFTFLLILSGYVTRLLCSRIFPGFHLEKSIIYNISRFFYCTFLVLSAAFSQRGSR